MSVSLTVEKASGQLIAYNAYCVFLSISRSYFTIFDLSWASNLHAAEILASDKEGRRVLINEAVTPCRRNSRLSGYMLWERWLWKFYESPSRSTRTLKTSCKWSSCSLSWWNFFAAKAKIADLRSSETNLARFILRAPLPSSCTYYSFVYFSSFSLSFLDFLVSRFL